MGNRGNSDGCAQYSLWRRIYTLTTEVTEG